MEKMAKIGIVLVGIMVWIAVGLAVVAVTATIIYHNHDEGKKNTEAEVKLKLSAEDYSFHRGDVVLLKPDDRKAVIVGYPFSWDNMGLYQVKYDSTGKDYAEKKLIRITHLVYLVRYVVKQEQPNGHFISPDKPTEILHYKEMNVNWYEISRKADQ